MKILVIIFGCIWPVLLNTVAGVRALDDVLEDVVRCYRIGRWARLWHFQRCCRARAQPQIFTGLRQSGSSIGITLMVVSEMFAASNGIGFALVQYQRTFAIPEMWSGIILLGLIGIALSLIFRAVEAWLLEAGITGCGARQRGRLIMNTEGPADRATAPIARSQAEESL